MPFAKTGGLADVAGTLPLELGRLGIEVLVAMPRYRGILARKKRLTENVNIVFVENEAYFNRSSLYGNEKGDYSDNLERFAFFCKRSLELTKELGFQPDIVHANDWQTALLPVLLKTKYSKDPFFHKTKSLLTIHNLAYQGIFPQKHYPALELPITLFSIDGFEFYGKINLLKAGILFADALSTVSPTYAAEIQTKEFGFGLEEVVKRKARDLHGILNGIDTTAWNPAQDKAIKKRFTIQTLEDKTVNKANLQKISGLVVDPAVPIFGMVTRLAEQKGLESFAEIADEFLSKDVQFVILGKGDGVYHTMFQNIGARHPKNTVIDLEFNVKAAHRIYAGCDYFIMPSLFEPCGLGQLISLRYGTVPIVRRTGGLADTIIDCGAHPKNGNGFSFDGRFSAGLMKSIGRALKIFEDKKRLKALRKTGMRADFSWKTSANKYVQLYKKMLSN